VSGEPPPPPQVSPDGKFYWNGDRWVPMQPSSLPAPLRQSEQVVVVKQPRGAWNSCVGYGCLAIAAIFVLAAVTAWCSGARP
jgi:hypothetical protein